MNMEELTILFLHPPAEGRGENLAFKSHFPFSNRTDWAVWSICCQYMNHEDGNLQRCPKREHNDNENDKEM